MTRKHIEFSKIILMVAGVINIIVIAFTLIIVWRTLDLTPLAYLIPSVGAEVATGTAFYYTKAKVENRIKLMKANKIQPDENSFNDNL
jgi:hypothetical protein